MTTTYQTMSYGPSGPRVEGTYATRGEAEQHAQRLRDAGCYASVETVTTR